MNELSKYTYRIKNAAPTLSISNSMRRLTGQTAEEYSTAGYKCICVYVQRGLSDQKDLFKDIAKAIIRIQSEAEHTYHILTFGFGTSGQLSTETKAMAFAGYGNMIFNSKVAKSIADAAGDVPESPAVIDELYPAQRVKGLGYWKSKIEKEDLLIIIGRKNEFVLSDSLKTVINSKMSKQILFAEIDADDMNYHYKDSDYFNRFAGILMNSVGGITGQEPITSVTATTDTENN